MELNNKIYRTKTNWCINHGNFDNTITTKFVQEGAKFELDDVEKIVAVERAICLEQLGDVTECEIYLNILPIHSIAHTSLVSNCSKLEVFINNSQEYLKTVYGELLDELDDIKTFRFDIKFNQDINQYTIKFITKSNDLWIYGIQLTIQRNTKTASDFLKKSINFENVEQRLKDSNTVLTARAQNCKNFIQSHKVPDVPQIPTNLSSLLAEMQIQPRDAVGCSDDGQTSLNSSSLENTIKSYIDEKFILLNTLVDRRLDDFETRLNKRLDHIVLLIENNKNSNDNSNKSSYN